MLKRRLWYLLDYLGALLISPYDAPLKIDSGAPVSFIFALARYIKGIFLPAIIARDFLVSNREAEICVLMESTASMRILTPVIMALQEIVAVRCLPIKINILSIESKFPLPAHVREKLLGAGCSIEKRVYYSPIIALINPENKLLLVTLDHRLRNNEIGTKLVDRLKPRGVVTVSIQHGGNDEFSLKSAASCASEFIFVWGRRAFRVMTSDLKVNSRRIRMVGNPAFRQLTRVPAEGRVEWLKDRVLIPDREIKVSLFGKKVLLLATSVHKGVYDVGDSHYHNEYLRVLYKAIDFGRYYLIIKPHPNDNLDAGGLYLMEMPSELQEGRDYLLVRNRDSSLYEFLSVSDLLLTRTSTCAEEALISGIPSVSLELEKFGYRLKHLQKYNSFYNVCSSQPDEWRQAINLALTEADTMIDSVERSTLLEDLILSDDGRAANRAAEEIIKLLDIGGV